MLKGSKVGWGEKQVSLARQVSPAPFPQPGSRSRSRAGPVGTRCFLRALGLLLRASLPLSPGTEPRKGGEPSPRGATAWGSCWCCCTLASRAAGDGRADHLEEARRAGGTAGRAPCSERNEGRRRAWERGRRGGRTGGGRARGGGAWARSGPALAPLPGTGPRQLLAGAASRHPSPAGA